MTEQVRREYQNCKLGNSFKEFTQNKAKGKKKKEEDMGNKKNI